MSQLNILYNFKSENFDNRSESITFIILHYTETKTLIDAVRLLTDRYRKVSCHYVVDKNGDIYNIVPDAYRAWHAGISGWDGLEDINSRSVGIEIVYEGESKKQFPKIQISSLMQLIHILMLKYKIRKDKVLGHSDIAPLRKQDPGKYFPWETLDKNNIGLWVNNKDKFLSKDLNSEQYEKLLDNLKKIGYPDIIDFKQKKENQIIIDAFHRHFFPKLIGKFPQISSLQKSIDLLKIKKT